MGAQGVVWPIASKHCAKSDPLEPGWQGHTSDHLGAKDLDSEQGGVRVGVDEAPIHLVNEAFVGSDSVEDHHDEWIFGSILTRIPLGIHYESLELIDRHVVCPSYPGVHAVDEGCHVESDV